MSIVEKRLNAFFGEYYQDVFNTKHYKNLSSIDDATSNSSFKHFKPSELAFPFFPARLKVAL